MTLSKNNDNTYTVTHEFGVSITFVKGMFNETQVIDVPDEFLDFLQQNNISAVL